MSTKAITLLTHRRAELVALEPKRANWSKVTEWHARTRPLVAQYYPEQLDQFDAFIKVRWTALPRVYSLSDRTLNSNSGICEAERRTNDSIASSAKNKLVAHLDAILELAGLDGNPAGGNPNVASDGNTSKQSVNVFVVHGHDEEMKQHVARSLSRLGLNPIILHEQPNSGRTIIEKFEVNADVSFAVVLLSPDDMAFPAGGDAKRATPRARQNVVLELGYFVGKLGRNRVFSLIRGDKLDIPSDFSGVVYTSYDLAGHWKFELVRELKSAGYTVDANILL